MKILTIGSGSIVVSFIQAISEVEGAELVGCYSRSLEKAQQLVETYHAKYAFDNLEEAFAHPEIDTVYIASPNSLHYGYAKQALDAKKHVICEKPFMSSVNQVKECYEIAKKNDVFLFEAITTIHLDNFKIVKESLSQIGDVRLVQCNFSQFSSKYEKYKSGQQVNVFDPAFEGGALKDVNIYNLHFVMGLFGAPDSVTYFPTKGPNGVDTNGILVCQYPTFLANLVAAKDSSSDNFGYVQGEKATLKISGSSLGRMKTVELLEHHTDLNQNPQNEIISINQRHHLTYELKDFVEIVETTNREKEKELLDHSISVLEVLERAYQQI